LHKIKKAKLTEHQAWSYQLHCILNTNKERKCHSQ